MGKKPSVKVNFLYNIAYQVLQVLTPLIVSPYISRVLKPEGIGTYSYTYSIANYFALACALGVSYYGSRTIAACGNDVEKRNKLFSEISSLKFLVSALAIAIYCVYGAFSDPDIRIYTFLQLLYILSIAFDINWFFFGLEEFKITVTRKVIIKLLSVVLIFLFVKDVDDLLLYTIIMGGSHLISELYLWISVRKRVKWVRPEWKSMWTHFLPMLLLFVPILAVQLYRLMAKIMLGSMLDDDVALRQVGQYENAEKIIMVCLGVVSAMGQVMLPRMAKLNADNDTSTMRKYIANSMKVMLAFSCAIAFGLLAVGRNFAPVFFGGEFTYCGSVLQILAVSMVLIAWSNVIRTQYLIPCKKDRIYLIAVWSGAVVSIALNAILIPRYYAMGAAIATLSAELVVCIIQTLCVIKALPLKSFFQNLLAYSTIGAIMYAAVIGVGYLLGDGGKGIASYTLASPLMSIALSSGILRLFVQVAVGGFVYLSLTFVYLWMTDRAMLRSAGKSVKRILKKLHLAH